jgi:YD repeat-containing protein
MRQASRLLCGSVAARFAFLVVGCLLCTLPALAAGSGPLPLPALANSLPGGFIAAGPAGTRLPGAAVVPGTGFNVQLGVEALLTGWEELYNGCFFDSGSWQINSQPSHGSLTTRIVSSGTDGCGNPNQYNDIFYTWTDPSPQATSDTFAATWSSGDGRFSFSYTWTASRAAPYKQVCDCSCPCPADPVLLSTGEMTETIIDYQTAGANKLGFTRHYNMLPNSFTGVSGLPTILAATLGPNWRNNYDRYLQLASANNQLTAIVAERANGQLLSFGWNGSQWAGDSDVDVTLTQSGGNFVLVDTDDTVETYAPVSAKEALLTSIQARNGYTQALQYNSSNQLASVTDTYGRSLAFTYQSGLLKTVTTPDGTVITFAYSAGGVLTSASYSTSPATTVAYRYENSSFPSALTGIVDEDGNRFTTWTYDGSGRMTSSQHADGADLTNVSYNSDGSRTVTNALGEQEVYKYTTLQGAPKLTEVDRLASSSTSAAVRYTTYDSNGYVASQTDWNGNQTAYVNDSRGQPTQITEAVGAAQQRTTTISYLSNYHLPSQIAAPGLTTNFAYDGSGEVLSRTLVDTTSNSWPYSTNGQTRIWRYTWSNFLLANIEGPRTDVNELTQFTYDGSGAVVAITKAPAQVTQITQHTGGGLPQTIVDPNGVVNSLTYDARQRLTSQTVNTSAGALTTTYSYDATGNLIQVTRPDGSAIANTYDAAHRLVAVADLFNQQLRYTLDALGDRTQTLVLDAGGNTTGMHSATFDALGRLLTDIGSVGQTTSYKYDSNGNRTQITDPLGRVTGLAFDALNRRIQTTDPANGVTGVAYDAQDHPVAVADPNGNSTSEVYDGFGDVVGISSPDSGATVSYYDPAGNRVQRVDAAGAVTQWSYDPLDRPTAKTFSDFAQNVTYTYDEASGGFGKGRLTSLTDAAGSLQRVYDERGNVVKETRDRLGASLATGYAYDAASRLAAIAYPSGWTASYARDQMGRVTAVGLGVPGGAAMPPSFAPPPAPGLMLAGPAMPALRAPGGTTVVASITYLPFGPVSGLTYGNGIAETRSFDLDYRQTSLGSSGSAAVQSLGYTYDADDNVTAIADGVTSGNSQGFSYDVLNRLVGATGGYGTIAYTYDPVGNLVVRRTTNGSQSATENFSYVANSNRLAWVSQNGNMYRQFLYTPTGNVAFDRRARYDPRRREVQS